MAPTKTAPETARAAYRLVEPVHAVAYFSPHLREAAKELQLHWRALYTGLRGAPLGPCSSAVVAAAFYNWEPRALGEAWTAALRVGLDTLTSTRHRLVARTLSDVWGDDADGAALADLADRLRARLRDAPMAGRTLAAAWADEPWPDEPALRLWHACTLVREWRGDGHVAALVGAGLDRVEAIVLNCATNPDPNVRGNMLGAERLRKTRGWTESDWADAAEILRARGLLEPTATDERLSPAGAELRDHLERRTDRAAAAIWRHDPEDAAQLLADLRPWALRVIEAGLLPGTSRRDATPRTPDDPHFVGKVRA